MQSDFSKSCTMTDIKKFDRLDTIAKTCKKIHVSSEGLQRFQTKKEKRLIWKMAAKLG